MYKRTKLFAVSFLIVCCLNMKASSKSEETTETVILQSSDRQITLVSERIGEGFYNYRIEKNGKRKVVWKSFWGRGTAKLSERGEYLAIDDTQRFDVLGPVLIFKIDDQGVVLLYQSPANSDQDEMHIGFSSQSFNGEILTISIYPNVFEEGLSRGTRGTGMKYEVDCSRLKAIVRPSFYDTSDPLFYNLNENCKWD